MKDAKDGIAVTFEGRRRRSGDQTFDRVLVSIGRQPNSAIPGLDKTARRGRQARLHRRRREPADRRADDLRDRRRRRRADARAQGVARGARRRRRDRRRPERRVRAGGDSRRRLHRSRDRLGGPDRDRRREAGAQGRGREVPLGSVRPRHLARPHRRRHQARHRSRRPSACSASASAVPAPAS